MSRERPTGWEEADKWFAASTGDGGEGGGAPPAPDPGPEDAGPPRCEVCGAELDADQTYCLECGSPTPLAPRLRRGRKGMAALAGAVAILGLGAGALAYAVADDGGDGGAGTVTTPTSPLIPGTVPLPPETAPTIGTLPPDTSLGTVPPPVTDIPPATQTGFDTVTGPGTAPTTPTGPGVTTDVPTTTETPPATTTAESPSAGGDSDWPPGRTAWTAILSSVRSEGDARAAKRRLIDQGEQAGVLPSDDFADLRPGYWVLFSGLYSGRDAAIAQAAALRPDFPGAYARRLEG
ncbi:MAG TPA: SPOR domain-containing protein [Miltoncostaeaceae bacterium]|nr:SPOR domain-containing protein [Miltoncostaeaceae bacterium]